MLSDLYNLPNDVGASTFQRETSELGSVRPLRLLCHWSRSRKRVQRPERKTPRLPTQPVLLHPVRAALSDLPVAIGKEQGYCVDHMNFFGCFN